MSEDDEMLFVLSQLTVRPSPEVENYRGQITRVLMYLVEKYVVRRLAPDTQRLHHDLDACHIAFSDPTLRAHIIPFIQKAIVLGDISNSTWTRPLVERLIHLKYPAETY